ncbi:MAG TPA: hypothetical protein VFL55_26270 [Acetobacteraceae bacterium]|nr:hypothetical protein [Acetobacteraceae bacterium]
MAINLARPRLRLPRWTEETVSPKSMLGCGARVLYIPHAFFYLVFYLWRRLRAPPFSLRQVAPAIVTIDPKTRVAKKGRRTVGSGAAAEDAKGENPLPADERAGEHQPNPPPIARKPAIVTVRDRKMVQRQHEQQQMAMLFPSMERSGRREAKPVR